MNYIYKLGKYEFKGPALWTAICESSYGASDPPLIQEWYEAQHDNYMTEECDSDYIDRFLWDYKDYEVLKILEKNNYHPDNIAFSDLTLKRIKEISETIKPCSSEPFLKKNFLKFIEKLEKYFEDDRSNSAYERSYEDFSLFIQDIDTDEDEEVAEFFGFELKITGVVLEGEEYDLDEIIICPDCGDAIIIKDLEAIWSQYNDEEYVDTSLYLCPACGGENSFKDLIDDKKNKHLNKNWLMSRLI